MNKDDREIIIKAICNSSELKDKFYDYERSTNFSLLLSQLDLFKNISTLVMAIIVTGYFLGNNLDSVFSYVSLFFASFTLVGVITYTREMIDLKANQIKEEGLNLKEKINDGIDKGLESLSKQKPEIFFDYAWRESIIKQQNDRLIYAGEIFTFCFFNSISFGILAFFGHKYNFHFLSYYTAMGIGCVYLITFKPWIIWLINILSIPLLKKNK